MEEVTCQGCKKIHPPGRSYCSNCGISLHPDTRDKKTLDGEGPNPQPSSELPNTELKNIRLEYKHLYLLADKHGIIPFRLTNLGGRIIRKIELYVESRAFANSQQPLAVERPVALQTSQHTDFRHCDFDINPKSGFFTVELKGYCFYEAKKVYAFRGSFDLIIRDSVDDKATLVIKESAGVMMEEVDIGALNKIVIEDGSGVDLGRIVQGSGKDASTWIKVRLEEDLEQTNLLTGFNQPPKKTSIPASPVDPRPKPHPRAFLELVESARRVHIWSGRECRIGRSKDNSDLVCMLLPNTGANCESNRLLSQLHCRLKVKENRVSLEDQSSKNGTFLDGSRMTSPADLKNGQVISLANVLSLRFHDFRKLDETREVSRAFNKSRTIHDYTSMISSFNLEEIREKAPIEAFVLRRLDGFQRLEYLFLIRSATIGSSKSVAISVSHESVSSQHARIMLIKGGYYLEDMGSEKGTMVNGSRLEPYMPEPLGHEAAIKLGEIEIRFRIPGR